MYRHAIAAIVLLLIGTACSRREETAAPAPEPATAATQEASRGADEEGFVSLFDGKTLNGWQGPAEDYEAVDGILVCKKSAHAALYTDHEYGDFILRLEYRLEPGGNNGVGIRAAISDKLPPAVTGMEIQILDDSFPEYQSLVPEQFNGSVYGAAAAQRGHMKPLGEWNAMEIEAKGSRIRVTLNGTQILDIDMDTIGQVKMHGYDFVGLHNKSGHIAICGHDHRVEFRNLRIKELS